ncbi:MAG: extracellular solute-binding protein [Chloroflexi bacterium]|nr:extracellular solute-binding protein [Chloroflexota bacterium]
MKKFVTGLIAFLAAAMLVLAACSPAATEGPAKAPAPASSAATVAARPAWEQKWESTLAAARKEGKLSVYALWRPTVRTALAQAFNEKFGVEAEFTPFARGAELLAKVQAEKRAGLNLADVFGAGGPTLVATMKPEGVLGQLEPLIILPEVLDPGGWMAGSLRFYDTGKTAIGLISVVERLFYNTEAVKEGEISSFKDLLKPQYKGKIVINDPTVTGGGNAMFTHLARRVWSVEEASDYLRRLVRDQESVVTRDNRHAVEWVARGKNTIGFGDNTDIVLEFINLGAPVARARVSEALPSSPQAGSMGVPSTPAHPNATAVFVNWILSREGQAVFSKSWGVPSVRSDVPTEGIHPALITRPGEKVELASEEFALMQGEMLEVAKKVLLEAQK